MSLDLKKKRAIPSLQNKKDKFLIRQYRTYHICEYGTANSSPVEVLREKIK